MRLMLAAMLDGSGPEALNSMMPRRRHEDFVESLNMVWLINKMSPCSSFMCTSPDSCALEAQQAFGSPDSTGLRTGCGTWVGFVERSGQQKLSQALSQSPQHSPLTP